jgi:hypothetical protein
MWSLKIVLCSHYIQYRWLNVNIYSNINVAKRCKSCFWDKQNVVGQSSFGQKPSNYYLYALAAAGEWSYGSWDRIPPRNWVGSFANSFKNLGTRLEAARFWLPLIWQSCILIPSKLPSQPKCRHPNDRHKNAGWSYWSAPTLPTPTRGRCYDHNFLRFLTIFCEKIGVFLKNQCYDQNFA